MLTPGHAAVPADILRAIADHVADSAPAEALLAEDRPLTAGELSILEDAARWWIRMRDIAGRQAEAIATRLASQPGPPADGRMPR